MSDGHFTPLYEQINPGYWIDIFSSDIDLESNQIKNYHKNLVVNVFDESDLPDPSTFNHLTSNLLIIRTSDPPLWVIVYFGENGPIFLIRTSKILEVLEPFIILFPFWTKGPYIKFHLP